ncbi:MAG: hypothetical protein WC796_03325 [Candidatus Pacearchaeota archaeon]|jgi:hypothetical protein
MTHLYLIPHWFFIYSIVFEAIFAIAAGLVAYFSFKVYSLCKQKESKWFGLGFMLISISYIVWLIINLFLIDNISDAVQAVNIEQIAFMYSAAIYSHMVLFILGIIFITCTTLKSGNIKMCSLLSIVSLFAVALSCNKGLVFYILASVFLAYLAIYYAYHYFKKRKTRNLISLIAFVLLFISHIHFIFATTNYLYYVLGHIFELVGYILILVQLLIIVKHK